MANKSYFEEQGEFFTKFDSPTVEKHGLERAVKLSESLITEEVVNETLPALRRYQVAPTLENLVEVADGIADSIYVLCHAAHALAIPLDKVWNEVHRSNMSKANLDGTVNRRADGKIIKAETYSPADIHTVLMEHETEKKMGTDYKRSGFDKRPGVSQDATIITEVK